MIKYGNRHSTHARGVRVTDILPQVDLVSASPPPDNVSGGNLTWWVGELGAGEMRSITLTVHIPPRRSAGFTEISSVRGDGYVYSRKELSTEEERGALVNAASIYGYYDQPGRRYNDTSQAVATIAGYAGTSILSVEHGSGRYEEDSQSSMNQTNKSVSLHKDIFAVHKPAEFSLPKIEEHQIRFHLVGHGAHRQ